MPDSTHWKMHFDGSKMLTGLGAGVVITSPKGDRLDYAVPLRRIQQRGGLDGPTAVTFLKEIIARYGYPHSIITDNGSNFAEGFKRYCGEMGIRMDLSSVAHPGANGQVEE
ncbi:hypothetical protein QYE76_016092 [Lolium multiflorum]|uniref:Integrase catalytic domain-containing protein n=1 Tax=Lolium multiflorum TaxID=4521 RepID=A0AAD8X8C6_LOLMU|nr:hypothetical protein QYE76_016092 [Lolium multiflorum]